uniref:WD repeat-containing protein 91 n=1 Tax=Oncorhynchus kisutch TaxID=8019 RepID=A0A8C7CS79_ONCKI
MGSAVERTDEHVREYLIYRGFTGTLKHLDSDMKADKEKGFRVDKIIDQLQLFIQTFDLNGLKDYWGYLDRRLFCRLEDIYRPTVSKLRTSLFRYYVVYTVQLKNIEKTQEFFQRQAQELQGQPEWRDWFILPFMPAPEQNPLFSPYFSRQWSDTFLVSLHNFLSVLFQCMHILLFYLTVFWKTNRFHVSYSVKPKDPVAASKEPRPVCSAGGTSDQQKRGESGDPEPQLEGGTASSDPIDPPPPSQTQVSGEGQRGTGVLGVEHPFIKLSQEEYGEHHSSIMYCRVDCSGRRVASLDVDGVIKVWSFNPIMQTKATIMSKSPLLSLEWATKPDRLLLLGSGVGTVRLYDTNAKKNLYEMTIDETHSRILSLACSPSGTSFVCSAAAHAGPGRSGSVTETVQRLPNHLSVSGQLLLWDTKTVKQQLQFSLEPGPVAINCTAFNHNGNLLVTGAADGVIRLFDMQRYDCAMSWRAHDGEVYSVEFSYDENTVFSIGEDGKFIQWNIHRCGVKQSENSLPQDATGPFVLSGYSGYKQVQVPRGRLFAFDSEGQHVLTCSNNGGLIYRLNSSSDSGLEKVLPLGGHKAPVVTVDWCSAMDCGTCLTASMDGKIKLSTLLAQKS